MSLSCCEMFLQYIALFISSQECQCLKSCHLMQTSCPSDIRPLVLQDVNINYACHVSWDVTCMFHSTTDDCRQFFRWTCLKSYPAVAKSKGSSQSLLISSGRILTANSTRPMVGSFWRNRCLNNFLNNLMFRKVSSRDRDEENLFSKDTGMWKRG